MEKNGSLVLTQAEVDSAKSGTVPERVSALWGLSLEELLAIIHSGSFQLLGDEKPALPN